MQDGIIKATGNSRTIYASLPATYAEFKAAVEAGTQALDISYNAAGWQQTPTMLNKANLLTDAVAALFGLTPSATPNDALNAASGLITTAQTTANARSKIASGSYTGTGTYGSGNKNSISFSFAPKLVIIQTRKGSPESIQTCIFMQTGTTPSSDHGFDGNGFKSSGYTPKATGSLSGSTLSWYNSDSSSEQMNISGQTYYYIAFG